MILRFLRMASVVTILAMIGITLALDGNAQAEPPSNSPLPPVTLRVGFDSVLKIEKAAYTGVVGDPKICDFFFLDAHTIVLKPVANGATNILIFNEQKELIATVDVLVGTTTSPSEAHEPKKSPTQKQALNRPTSSPACSINCVSEPARKQDHTKARHAEANQGLVGIAEVLIYGQVCGADKITPAAYRMMEQQGMQFPMQDRKVAFDEAQTMIADFGSVDRFCSDPSVKKFILQVNIAAANH